MSPLQETSLHILICHPWIANNNKKRNVYERLIVYSSLNLLFRTFNDPFFELITSDILVRVQRNQRGRKNSNIVTLFWWIPGLVVVLSRDQVAIVFSCFLQHLCKYRASLLERRTVVWEFLPAGHHHFVAAKDSFDLRGSVQNENCL